MIDADKLRSDLERAKATLDEAVHCANQAYQFNAGSYSYEALAMCTQARNAVAKLTADIIDLSHYLEAIEPNEQAA